ncbi:MAG: type II toxin-antitoxin system VapC family toxin [Caulobacterales bacterium]
MIVLDTNVVSEALRRDPAQSVVGWMRAQDPAGLFTTAICEAEILYGLAIMPDGRRRAALQAAARAIFETDFSGRILPFDSDSAKSYIDIVATRRRAGRPIGQAGAQIAAIARANGATLATRNVNDFTDCGVGLINPWTPAPLP